MVRCFICTTPLRKGSLLSWLAFWRPSPYRLPVIFKDEKGEWRAFAVIVCKKDMDWAEDNLDCAEAIIKARILGAVNDDER